MKTIYDQIRERWGDPDRFVRDEMHRLMRRYDISHSRLARRMGTHRVVVGRWYRSVDHPDSTDSRTPDLESRIRISEALEEIIEELTDEY